VLTPHTPPSYPAPTQYSLAVSSTYYITVYQIALYNSSLLCARPLPLHSVAEASDERSQQDGGILIQNEENVSKGLMHEVDALLAP
jgi:hypothetical protein